MLKIIKILIGMIICILGVYFFLMKSGVLEKEELIEYSDKVKAVEYAIPVRTEAVMRKDFMVTFRVSGFLISRENASIRFRTGGIVKDIKKREGEAVKKGEIILELESREHKIHIERAQNKRLKAYSEYLSNLKITVPFTQSDTEDDTEIAGKRDVYERALTDFVHRKISIEDLYEAEERLLKLLIEKGAMRDHIRKYVSGLTQAELDLKEARLAYDYLTIRAPFDGSISSIGVSIGEMVSQGEEAFRIVNRDNAYIEAHILESELSKISPGSKANIQFISIPDKVFQGEIRTILPKVVEGHRLIRVLIELNDTMDIPMGIGADIDIVSEYAEDVLVVNRDAVLVRMGRPLIFIVEDGKAEWKYINIRSMDDKEAWIEGFDINPGDRVIVDGHLALGHQASVRDISR